MRKFSLVATLAWELRILISKNRRFSNDALALQVTANFKVIILKKLLNFSDSISNRDVINEER